jgi:nucleoside-diphosphate-sugar epimerase
VGGPKRLTAMRVLVTGGSGYIGSALVPRLVAAGHAVRVLDLAAPPPAVLCVERPPEVALGDLRDAALVQRALRDQDMVVHLGFLTLDRTAPVASRGSTEVNVTACERLVAACVRAGVRRLVLASSCSLYGAPGENGALDETALLRPASLYAEQKAACEEILFRTPGSGLERVALRAATVCGASPRLRWDLTFNRFAWEASRERRIRVAGAARIRPWIAIADLCRLYRRLLELPGEVVAGQVFNAAFGNRTLGRSAAIVARLFGADVVLQEVSAGQDRQSYRISSRKARVRLAFTPRVSLPAAVEGLDPWLAEADT